MVYVINTRRLVKKNFIISTNICVIKHGSINQPLGLNTYMMVVRSRITKTTAASDLKCEI